MLHALLDGARRAGRAWRLLLVLWVVNLLVALPLALALAQELGDDLGRSLAHRDQLEELELGWYGELQAEAQGPVKPLARTFGPAILGGGAFFGNLERWWSGRILDGPPLLVGAGLLYALVWAFLLGGVLERLAWLGGKVVARERAAGFFAGCGRHVSRFVLLALLSAVFYYFVFRLARSGFGWLEEATIDVTSEGTVLLWVALGAALVVLLLSVVRVIFDYAKIAVVIEDRGDGPFALLRGTFAGLGAGLRFVAARPLSTLGLYWLIGLVGVLLLGLYSAVAPTGGGGSWPAVILAFLLGQLAIVGKLALRLVTLGAETAYFAPTASPHRRTPGAITGQGPTPPPTSPPREPRPIIAS
jgi:hypothetical protein